MLLKQKTKTQNMSLKFLVMGLYSLNLKISKYIKISFSYIIELKDLFVLNNFILKLYLGSLILMSIGLLN